MSARDLHVLCPEWCDTDLADHQPVATNGEGFYIPHGCVEFGPLAFGEGHQWPELDAMTYVVHVEAQGVNGDDISDPAELRRMAADLMNAADWLEAQQSLA